MTKTIQLLRGTTAQNDAFTGAAGELTVDTTTNELRVHDGSTAGGHIIYTKSDVDTALSGKADAATTYTKTEVDNIASGKADTATTYTKTEVDNIASGKADIATTLAGYGITDGTNTDLSNLTSTGVNIGNWSSNVTNCIIEVPQDINVELATNGTLTLKAGSKVYVPNGSGVFNTYTTTSDLTITRTDNQDCMIWYDPAVNSISIFPKILFFSGSTAPTAYTYMYWYDTANNVCKVTSNGGSSWTETPKSLPLCIVATNGSKISEIKQVFNGFGYVGSTTFALPGVKGLAPNGRNADGTLKNNILVLNTVITTSYAGGTDGNYFCVASAGGEQEVSNIAIIKNLSEAPYTTPAWYYSIEDNILGVWNPSTRTWSGKGSYFIFGKTKRTSGTVTSLTVKQAFRAVDYSDFTDLSNKLSSVMGAVNYSSATSISSGWTATANGYVFGGRYTTGSMSAAIYVNGATVFYVSTSHAGNVFGIAPVKLGDVITLGAGTYYFVTAPVA